jgi:hypothetical protein
VGYCNCVSVALPEESSDQLPLTKVLESQDILQRV